MELKFKATEIKYSMRKDEWDVSLTPTDVIFSNAKTGNTFSLTRE